MRGPSEFLDKESPIQGPLVPSRSRRRWRSTVCRLRADFVAEVGAQQSVALVVRGFRPLLTARSNESGGFDASIPMPATAMPHRQQPLAAVGPPAWRAGAGSVQ